MPRNVQVLWVRIASQPAARRVGAKRAMAERNTAKSKRSEGAKSAAKASDTQLAAENARLHLELAAARSRILELEQKHAEIINRIDWAIDSLHNLSD